jgi:hypothetical protein
VFMIVGAAAMKKRAAERAHCDVEAAAPE